MLVNANHSGCSIKLVEDEVVKKWEWCAGLCGPRTWSFQEAYGSWVDTVSSAGQIH